MPTPTIDQHAPPSTPQPRVERAPKSPPGLPSRLSSGQVWGALEHSSFAVLAWITPRGEPRSSGVVYGVAKGKIYVAVAPGSWKARQLVSGQRVSVTVPVRRGAILSLLVPIPPATVSFQTKVRVFPDGALDLERVSPKLTKLLPADRKEAACILELSPEGEFLTYGIGVSLSDMRNPALSRARVPVGQR